MLTSTRALVEGYAAAMVAQASLQPPLPNLKPKPNGAEAVLTTNICGKLVPVQIFSPNGKDPATYTHGSRPRSRISTAWEIHDTKNRKAQLLHKSKTCVYTKMNSQ
ncbi:unnamed protein product [Prunus armeniaca]|uniref:Uncharacterized protein n=1 Tax=Prunus armeniaca TaxID=36596 RepID=A0A6J5Y6I9_PRUAR|nr:unnamed protein product [Prunus armeniaca]